MASVGVPAGSCPRAWAFLLCSLCGLALLTGASATGAMVTLFNGINGALNTTAGSFVVAPSPTLGSPAGCTDLPVGFVPQSGIFDWASASGTANCSFFVFYIRAHCSPSSVGGETAVKAAATPTIINNFAANKWQANAVNGVSVGCAYDTNPCVQYPCPDPNAICSTTSIIVTINSTGESFSQYTSRDCNTCKEGYTKLNGRCTADPCSNYVCPAPAMCVGNNGVASCWCPDDYEWNDSFKQCISVGPQRWLEAINSVRTKVVGCKNVTWNGTLADAALKWAVQNFSSQCGSGSISLKPDTVSKAVYKVSENDGYIRETKAQAAAVDLWMTAPKLAPGARINSTKTSQIGCAKSPCYSGAFFVCFLWPFTY